MLNCIKGGDLVFDIGANVGDATALFLSHGARVVAFEPQPKCVQALEVRFKEEIEHGDVVIYPVGVSNKSGRENMAVCSISPTVSTFSKEWQQGRFRAFNWDKTIEVQMMRLADVFEDIGVPKYMKVDVEGWEFPVLSGMNGVRPQFISFEHAHECISKTKLCIDLLGDMDFNFFYHDTYKLSLKRWVTGMEIKMYLESQTDPMFWGNVCVREF